MDNKDPLDEAAAAETATDPDRTEVESSAASEVEQLRRALDEKTDRHLRAVAELENAKRRAQRERDDYVKYANESLIRDLVPVLDNFNRALSAARETAGVARETAGVVEGVELIRRELLKVLEKFGVEQYSALGQRFDPARHEAVARVVSVQHPEGTVVNETLPGYSLHGRVLRPAMVAVSAAPDTDA
jgi:molecular chaperone GrpE